MIILVAEDEPAILAILLKKIKASAPEASILSARNGQQALEVAKGYSIDLLVTDKGMGPGDGVYLSQELLKVNPGVTVFMMSGDSRNLPQYAREAGAHRFFDKFEELQDLFVEVGRLVRGEFQG